MSNFVYVLYFIFSSLYYQSIHSRTEKDDQKHLLTKNGRIIIGTILGNRDYVKQGLDEGGTPNAFLHNYFGDKILHLGKPYVDFPVCPAIHLAINYGQYEHLNAASLLFLSGADINHYMIPSIHNKNIYERGYPPGIMFGLGLGQNPMYFHTGFIQRFHKTFPNAFNMTTINQWILESGNPPLIHMCVLLDNLYGVSVLIKELQLPVNIKDHKGITALHIAAWKNDLNLMIMLIQYGANVFEKDHYNRTPLFYAIMRGNFHAVIILLTSIQSKKRIFTNNKIFELQRSMLSNIDSTNKTIFDLASESPLPLYLREYLFNQSIIYNIPIHMNEKLSLLSNTKEEFLRSILRHKNNNINSNQNNIRTSQQSIDAIYDIINEEISWNYPINYSIFNDFPYLLNIHYYLSTETTSQRLLSYPMITKIESQLITTEIFLDQYYSRQIPLLIMNDLTLRSNIWAYIMKDDFIERYGDLLGQINMSFNYQDHIKDDNNNNKYSHQRQGINKNKEYQSLHHKNTLEYISLRSYINKYMQANNSIAPPCYNYSCYHSSSTGSSNNNNSDNIIASIWSTKLIDQDQNLRHLIESDLPIPNIFKLCYNNNNNNNNHSSDNNNNNNNEAKSDIYYDDDDDQISSIHNKEESYHIYVGPQYSGSTINVQNATWNLLLIGQRICFLAAPGMHINISTILNNTEILSKINNNNIQSLSQLSAWEWSQLIAPLLIKDGSITFVIQQPGDVLFIPYVWQSVIINLSDTIVITKEFCNRIHTDHRIPPLGFTIYGGEDKHYGLGMFKTHIHSSYQFNIELDSEDTRFPVFDSIGSSS